HNLQKLQPFQQITPPINQIQITNLKKPQLTHPLPLTHPTYIHQHPKDNKTFPFHPQHLRFLLHFLPQFFKQQ
uniref:DUF3388 domain-containing protein n=1 Tax=Staphylococcus aureus TaxID=1280 RepID=UPI00119DC2CB